MFWRRRQGHERDLERELSAHLELEAEEQRESGLCACEAQTAALRAFGNTTSVREEIREMRSWTSLERLWHDLRYAARMFAATPAFVTIAALSLALGIGGNAAMFALVNTLLIRPLPFPDSGRLVRLTGVYPKAALPMFQQQSRMMDIASVSPGSEFNLTGMGETLRLRGSSVSDNLFSVLGTPVAMGRVFQPGEQRPGADLVVVLSYGLWRTAFNSDTGVIGRVITLDGISREVIGVMPASFSFPSAKVQFWIPARLDPSNEEEYWGKEYVPFLARLRPGATLLQAQSETHALMDRLRPQFPFPMPRNWNGDATAVPLQADMVGEFRDKLLILFCSVGIVLLIACANVASLLFARSATRRREIALRAALGAGRWRIVRQLLTESILLAGLGAGLGLLVGSAALHIFRSVLPPDTPGISSVGIDWQVTAFAAGLAVISGIVFGMGPSLSASQIDLVESMKTGSARSASTSWARIRGWIIIGEVGLTVVLVVSAGLLLKSLFEMSEVNPGFSPGHILTMRISPNQSLCTQRASCIALYDRLLRDARGISSVSDAAVANTIPLDGQIPSVPVDVEDHPRSAEFPSPMFWTGAVTPDYFHMLQIPILAGRGFSDSDGTASSGIVLISASTARRFWPNENAVGKHIKVVWDRQWRTVVGVVGDVRQFNLAGQSPEGISGTFYMPYAQSVQADHQIPAAMDLLVKTAATPAAVPGEMRRIARELNPNLPLSEVTPLHETVSRSTANFQSTIWLFLSFAAVAVLLAAVGIYGLVSNSVTQRTYEIGLRVAIGATRQEILGLMLMQSVRLTLIGIGAGVAVSLVLTRFLASLLFGVGALDPITFTAVCGFMLGIAVLASYAPAWRAANLDPVKSLRVE